MVGVYKLHAYGFGSQIRVVRNQRDGPPSGVRIDRHRASTNQVTRRLRECNSKCVVVVLLSAEHIAVSIDTDGPGQRVKIRARLEPSQIERKTECGVG